jgi:succinate-semialdehyde dehydrogenase/glutarate-semialdehyde dehydrogenase
MPLQSLNPLTGKVTKQFDEFTPEQTAEAVRATAQGYAAWKTTDFAHRAECLRSLAQVLKARADEFAAIMAEEMGKPVTFGRAEVLKCAGVCEFYAQNGQAMLTSEPVAGCG